MTCIRTQIFALIAPLLVAGVLCHIASGQDTQYGPDSEQIPVPGCLTFSDAHDLALDGGFRPCPAGTHEAWLKDIRHWRAERRIRVGYDGARYTYARSAVGAVKLHPAADDGAGPLLLRSGARQIHGGPLSG